MTMGIVQVEQNRLRQQEIEVKALVALVEYGHEHHKNKALAKLHRIAHPEILAAQINMMEKSEQATL
jgi:hypothetical protein